MDAELCLAGAAAKLPWHQVETEELEGCGWVEERKEKIQRKGGRAEHANEEVRRDRWGGNEAWRKISKYVSVGRGKGKSMERKFKVNEQREFNEAKTERRRRKGEERGLHKRRGTKGM